MKQNWNRVELELLESDGGPGGEIDGGSSQLENVVSNRTKAEAEFKQS